MPLRAIATALLLALGACAPTSNLEPTEPFDGLDHGETAQLCRFTVDVIGDTDATCDPEAPGSLFDFDACMASPPWLGCPPPGDEAADVESWEDCVNALVSGFCSAEADASCWALCRS